MNFPRRFLHLLLFTFAVLANFSQAQAPDMEALPAPDQSLLFTQEDYDAGDGNVWSAVRFPTLPGMLYGLQTSTDLITWTTEKTFYGLGNEVGIALFPVKTPPPAVANGPLPALPPPCKAVSIRMEQTTTGHALLSWRSLVDSSPVRYEITGSIVPQWQWIPFYDQKFGDYYFYLGANVSTAVPPVAQNPTLSTEDAAMLAVFEAHLAEMNAEVVDHVNVAISRRALPPPPPRENDRKFASSAKSVGKTGG